MRGRTVTMHLSRNVLNQCEPLYQYDYGQVLILTGVELPMAYEVHFSNGTVGESKTSVGGADGVVVPDEYLTSGESVYVWLFLHEGNADGETEYKGMIPVIRRARPSDAEPTPVQQDAITQAIAALNEAVEVTGREAEAAGQAQVAAEAAQAAAELAQGKAEDAQTAAESSEVSAGRSAESAEGSAQTAVNSAGQAEGYAESAERSAERAEQAANNAGYMWIEMNGSGHLIYTRTDAVDVDFDLNDNGHLLLEVI